MVGFTANAGALKLTIGALGTLQDPRAVARIALGEAAKVLREEVSATISLRDHSLSDLAKLGHPYAARHGSIQTSALGHDEHRVHRHTGRLVNALRMEISPSDPDSWRVRLDDMAAPEARWVVYGTRKMLPRDPLWVTAMDPRVQKLMMTAVVRTLGKQLRTKGFIRFGKGAPGPSPLSVG